MILPIFREYFSFRELRLFLRNTAVQSMDTIHHGFQECQEQAKV